MIKKILKELRKEVKDLELKEHIPGIKSDFYVLKSKTIKPADCQNIKKNIKFFCGQDISCSDGTEPRSLVIEVPKKEAKAISWTEYHEKAEESPLSVCFGADPVGKPVVADISKMPHLLIAGATGQGKSVAINNILATLINKNKPEELKLVLIDPKAVELGIYKNSKHLYCSIKTNKSDIYNTLSFIVKDMELRYKIFADKGFKNLSEYNENENLKIPRIVVIIDEMADLFLEKDKEYNIESLVIKIAQKARAAGIHIIAATQRPSTDVISGLIKANFPCRLALKTSSPYDSRTILGATGAEKLNGAGDSILFYNTKFIRCYGAYIDSNVIQEVL